MTVNGKIIRWKDMVCSHGPTEDAMRALTLMIRKKAKVTSTGQMVVNMKVVGKMESNTVLELIPPPAGRPNRVNGPMARDCIGFLTPKASNELGSKVPEFK